MDFVKLSSRSVRRKLKLSAYPPSQLRRSYLTKTGVNDTPFSIDDRRVGQCSRAVPERPSKFASPRAGRIQGQRQYVVVAESLQRRGIVDAKPHDDDPPVLAGTSSS